MSSPNADRRVKRTTKRIESALTELMLEIPFEKITVQDIIDRADVSRSTFYAHYENKDDLLTSDFEQVLNMLNRHLEDEAGDPFNSVELFRHVGQNYNLYRALLWGRGIELLFEKGHVSISKSLEAHLSAHLKETTNPSVPLPLLANHVSASLLAMLRWWLENEMPYSPEDMDASFRSLVLPGVLSSIDLESQAGN